MSIFPTDEKLIFILCDDFRHEGDGKLSVFGLYGDNLVVPANLKQVLLQSLGIYVALRDGVGHFKMSVEVSGPNNATLIPRGPAQQVEKKPDGWMNVALKVAPFQGVLGAYVMKILLENSEGARKEYVRTFSISNPSTETKH